MQLNEADKPFEADYAVGADTSMGRGGEMGSNSVASVVNRTTGEKVGQFTTALMSPMDFAEYCLALCRWLGNAFLIWEDNGPGGEFSKAVKEANYRNVFYRQDETKFRSVRTTKPGWWTSKPSKRLLLSTYSKAIMNATFINRCEEALRECGEYVVEPDGDITHQKARDTIDPTAHGENHGDMVIADALANRAIGEVTKNLAPVQAGPPKDCFLARRQLAEKRRRQLVAY
jgi:hypothetical protein